MKVRKYIKLPKGYGETVKLFLATFVIYIGGMVNNHGKIRKNNYW